MEVIRTHQLSKAFPKTLAVNKVSLHVKAGEIYGFVGLNGAGKTTTIRMLLGLIRPTGGEAYLFGEKVGHDHNIWKDVGYLVETPCAYPNLSVYENLVISYRLRNLPDINSIDEVIENLKLTHYRNIKSKHLSTGNQQRLGLAKALIHKPKLLLLDEPINGLDPSGIVEIRNLLKNLASMGATVFLSSHILTELSRLADKIGIIHEGKLVRELLHDELEEQLLRKLIIDTPDNSKAIPVLKSAGHNPSENHDGQIEIENEEALAAPEQISSLLVNHKLPPKQIFLYEEDLEHYFLRIINEE
ncbi:MAG: ABC transporter ATP-binding protein [Bacteroidales bacterium]|nr:ABC transporter ATP-binding protein [Bacteroidales bacterium]